MYFLLALFFGSLLSILLMVGRKLVLLRHGNYEVRDEVDFEIPYIHQVKHLSIKGLKKVEHEALVFVVKSAIQFSGFIKNKYIELNQKIRNINIKKYAGPESVAGTEVSKILKIASVYKDKITQITHQIKEEEKKM